jgi:hypothetical protein
MDQAAEATHPDAHRRIIDALGQAPGLQEQRILLCRRSQYTVRATFTIPGITSPADLGHTTQAGFVSTTSSARYKLTIAQ